MRLSWKKLSAILGAVVLIGSTLAAWDQIKARTPWVPREDFAQLVQVVTPQRLQSAEMRVAQLNAILTTLAHARQKPDPAVFRERLWLCQQIQIMRRLLRLPPSLVCRG